MSGGAYHTFWSILHSGLTLISLSMVSWLARQPYSFLPYGDLKLVNHTDVTFHLDGLYADLHAGNLWKFPLM